MGETFCQTGGVHMAMDIVRNQINIDREFLFQANPSTAQGCPSVLLDWQIKSHLDARIGKKKSFSIQWCWPPARDDVVVPAQAGQ